MTLNNPYLHFQSHAFFDAEYLRNGATYRHSVVYLLLLPFSE